MRSDHDLFTPEMDQAERELDARIDYAMSVAREVQAKSDELEQAMRDREPPSDEDVERIRTYVLGHATTDEWTQVVDRINRGELTWRQVVEGLVTGHLDRGVAAAFASLSTVPPASMAKLIEIGVFPDTAPADDKPNHANANTNRAAAQDDEPWYDEDPLGRRRS
jgi:hypothetical protein